MRDATCTLAEVITSYSGHISESSPSETIAWIANFEATKGRIVACHSPLPLSFSYLTLRY